ncbi:DUF4844 domain-containing protein [Aeromonas diversa]|uniref:DUF4844 domain-containing protein n=1 Tax=Aeromonas diversa TaxID=502790 RepID=UPI00399F7CCF
MENNTSIELLEALEKRDNFCSDGFLYTGVLDEQLKLKLSNQFGATISEFKKCVLNGASKEDLLYLLEIQINSFEREELETEDAENLASNFEKIMDCVGLESSEGILSDWMYGF